VDLDRIDRKNLRELTANGRLSDADLAVAWAYAR